MTSPHHLSIHSHICSSHSTNQPFIHLFIHLSIPPWIHPFFHSSVHPTPAHSFVHPLIYPSIYFSIQSPWIYIYLSSKYFLGVYYVLGTGNTLYKTDMIPALR